MTSKVTLAATAATNKPLAIAENSTLRHNAPHDAPQMRPAHYLEACGGNLAQTPPPPLPPSPRPPLALPATRNTTCHAAPLNAAHRHLQPASLTQPTDMVPMVALAPEKRHGCPRVIDRVVTVDGASVAQAQDLDWHQPGAAAAAAHTTGPPPPRRLCGPPPPPLSQMLTKQRPRRRRWPRLPGPARCRRRRQSRFVLVRCRQR